MPRKKKKGRNFNILMDEEIYDRLEKYCEDVGQTKTTATERIIGQFLDKYEINKQKNRTDYV